MSNYIEAIKKAVEVSQSDVVPNELREKAFEVILEHEITGGSTSYDSQTDFVPKEVDTSRSKKLNDWERKIIDGLPTGSIVANGNRRQQTIWSVVTLYSRGQEANSESIRTILKDELGITPQSVDNTSHTLRSLVPDYLNRTKEGKSYYYKPTRDALDIFEN